MFTIPPLVNDLVGSQLLENDEGVRISPESGVGTLSGR